MKYLLVFLLWNTLAFGSVKPMDRVRAYAGNHKVTVTVRSGVYWIEMEDSDIFGIGPTVNDAAEDFMMDVDLEAHETGKPHLTLHYGGAASSSVCPATAYCI